MKFIGLTLAAAIECMVGPALAANVDVQLLNKGDKGAMVFQPDLVKIAVGDTVTFLPTDKGHDVEGITGMMPASAQPFKGQMGQPFTETKQRRTQATNPNTQGPHANPEANQTATPGRAGRRLRSPAVPTKFTFLL